MSERHMQPHDLDAEESVLGACLVSPAAAAVVTDIIEPEDFYRPNHGTVFKSMMKMFGKGVEIDQVTLSGQLEEDGVLERVGGKAFIHTLAETVPAAGNAAQYATIVRDLATRRSLIRVAQEVAEMGYTANEQTVDQIIDRSEEMLYGVSRHAVEDQGHEIADLGAAAVQRIDAARDGKRTAGHPTGYVTLDSVLGGLAESNLSLLAARPSQGKTALATCIARQVAEQANVAFFSMEMTKEEIHERLYCAEARVNSTRIHLGAVDNDEYLRLFQAIEDLSKLKLHLDDSSGLTMNSLRSKVRRYAAHTDPHLIIVDYIQLMTGDGESRNYEIANISRAMKQMAREYECHVMCLSQLSRPDKNRAPNPKPQLSDLRDSGALEQDADLVLTLWAPTPKEDDENPRPADHTLVEVLKHRNGPLGECWMQFIKEFTLFKEIVR